MTPARVAVPLLAAVALALTGCGGSSTSGPEPGPSTPTSGQTSGQSSGQSSVPDESPTGLREIAVPSGPVGLAAADYGIWVVSVGDGSVSLLQDGAVTETVYVPDLPLRAAVLGKDLYVTSFGGKRLARVTPGKARARTVTDLGAGPEGVVAAFGSLWVVEQDAGTLARVDPRTGTVQRRIDIGKGARLVTADAKALFVSHTSDNRVLRVDPRTGKVARSPRLPRGPQGIAVHGGRVWVACTFGEHVVSLDATSLEVVTDAKVEGSPDALAVAPDGRVLVVAQTGPALVEVDPDSGEPLVEVTLGSDPDLKDRANLDLVVDDDAAYVSSYLADLVYVLPLDSL